MKCASTGGRSSGASHVRAARLLAAGRNLYLAGFMGTGKTATARALARALRVPWTDVDREIEREAGMSVAEIFAQRGERGFRSLERRVIGRVARAGGSVVALGGGAVCFPGNRAALRGTGPVVVLSAPPEVIWRRIGRAGTRPLVADGDGRARMLELLARRRADYGRYRLRVDTAGRTPGAVAAEVIRAVEAAGRVPRASAATARKSPGAGP